MNIPPSVDSSLVDSLQATSSHGHYTIEPGVVERLRTALDLEGVGPFEVVSQFSPERMGMEKALWMEFSQWAYMNPVGEAQLVMAPPRFPLTSIFDKMRESVDEGHVAVSCMFLPLEDVKADLGKIGPHCTVGISMERLRWNLLIGGTRRRDLAVCVIMTEDRNLNNTLRAALDSVFWFNEHPKERSGR